MKGTCPFTMSSGGTSWGDATKGCIKDDCAIWCEPTDKRPGECSLKRSATKEAPDER